MPCEREKGEALGLSGLLGAIRQAVEEGLRQAEREASAEKLAGNVVKEAWWKGEACAYADILQRLNEYRA